MNEPIPGQGIFWSSAKGKPYPVPIRVISFNKIFKALDKEYKKPEADTFAKKLRETFKLPSQISRTETSASSDNSPEGQELGEEKIDFLHVVESELIDSMKNDLTFKDKVESEEGIAWGKVNAIIEDRLPETLEDRKNRAYKLTPKVMTEIYGQQNSGWHTYKNSKGTLYIKSGGNP